MQRTCHRLCTRARSLACSLAYMLACIHTRSIFMFTCRREISSSFIVFDEFFFVFWLLVEVFHRISNELNRCRCQVTIRWASWSSVEMMNEIESLIMESTILLIYISAGIMGHNYYISNRNMRKSVRFKNYIEFLIQWRKPHHSSSICLEMRSKKRLLPHGKNGKKKLQFEFCCS